ncbi:MAG: phosphonate ABC transporter, permease protein PhnE [Candidatus Izemoplasmatales bacterium]|jgi:phosphonate transport system permease protein|nr:phosphonate ABC transporter, permease protein PhnE [Candidatus Izemoplasmatales bacterium]
MATLSKPVPMKPKANSIKKTIIFIIVISLIIWAFDGVNYNGLMPSAAGTIVGMWNGILHPDVSYLTDWSIDGLPYAIVETIAIAISGTFVSGVLAIPFALLASQNIVGKRVSKVGKFIITMIRTFPELILALIFIGIVGPGAPAGILALGVHSIGMLGKLFSESIESMDIGVKEALESCGGNSAEVLFRAVIPQVLPEFLSYTLFRFEINMRAAATLGLVGAGGIGAPLIFAIKARDWERTGIIVIVLIITVTIIDIISSKIRKKLV